MLKRLFVVAAAVLAGVVIGHHYAYEQIENVLQLHPDGTPAEIEQIEEVPADDTKMPEVRQDLYEKQGEAAEKDRGNLFSDLGRLLGSTSQ
ncbi:hypothetical protein B0H94_10744 [Salsuginibacillus halophilus]|uniref:Uncharacterized protein n=1 Tax=Salsuginibacillus halophilus TaxID=517424 RepID=A0A2P8HFN8_9BACI|nr:hypothetical protein [Salsuginibacillus halophilus]PSL45039.1 hypothetical protein B0H94_10744 [Salsuginibacillus halophilus]